MLQITSCGHIMSDRADRLRQAFQASSYARNGMSPRATALQLGWNVNSFKSGMNGNAPFSFETAKTYADKFKVRAEWLYDGNGPIRDAPRAPRSPIEVPLLSWVSAGQAVDVGDIEHQDGAERIVVGGLPPSGQYFATEVRGDSMDRFSPEGSRIIVDVNDRTPRSGKFYLVSLNGDPTYKRYESRPVRRLEPCSVNPAHATIFLKDKGWLVIGRVVRSIIDL